MRIVTPQQANEIDKYAIENFGMPGFALMENAATGVFQEILAVPHIRKVVVIAGRGNNGGDAFAVVRKLDAANIKVRVAVTCSESYIDGDALINLSILKKTQVPIKFLAEETFEQDKQEIISVIAAADLVVDGIYGTGLNRNIVGFEAELIKYINKLSRYTVSIDVPSGLSASTGMALGTAIIAKKTVAMQYVKVGLLTGDGPDHAGVVSIVDIGIPRLDETISKIFDINAVEIEDLDQIIPQRLANTNKGSNGRILIVGSSNEMRGAVAFAASAALAAGAGLVYIATTQRVWNTVAKIVPDAIAVILNENSDGSISESNAMKIRQTLKKVDSVVVGCGMTNSTSTKIIVEQIIESAEPNMPIIIDADGLNSIARQFDPKGKNIIITPHPGEMARLVNTDIETVQKDRLNCARDYAIKHQVTVVLKGVGTIIASPKGKCYINVSGNSGMAVAGMGDVLAGICGVFSFKGVGPTFRRVAGAVYLHGLSGDKAIETNSLSSLTSSKLIKCIDLILKSIGR